MYIVYAVSHSWTPCPISCPQTVSQPEAPPWLVFRGSCFAGPGREALSWRQGRSRCGTGFQQGLRPAGAGGLIIGSPFGHRYHNIYYHILDLYQSLSSCQFAIIIILPMCYHSHSANLLAVLLRRNPSHIKCAFSQSTLTLVLPPTQSSTQDPAVQVG